MKASPGGYDEARVGQKNKITRRWARRGSRPPAPQDQRTASTYIFGAICPSQGKGAALVLPRCNIIAMSLHLAEIATAVAPGAHVVLLMDQAGWHLSHQIVVPPNITIIPLPPKCPEFKPVENVWQFMRQNWLSNRDFRSYDAILNHCCEARNKLTDQPWRIMSIGMREWARRYQSERIGINESCQTGDPTYFLLYEERLACMVTVDNAEKNSRAHPASKGGFHFKWHRLRFERSARRLGRLRFCMASISTYLTENS